MKTTVGMLLLALLGSCSADGGSGIVGTWVGYVEGPQTLSSDRIEIQIDELAEDGTIVGSVSFGEQGTLPPPTDPDVGYPEGLYNDFGPNEYPFVEKFSYSLSGVFDAANHRLLGTRNISEVWSSWCSMQTAYLFEGAGYNCLPNCGGMQTPEGVCTLSEACEALPGVVVDCYKWELCGLSNAVCSCDARGCSGEIDVRATLDLHLDGDDLRGPVNELGMGFLRRQ